MGPHALSADTTHRQWLHEPLPLRVFRSALWEGSPQCGHQQLNPAVGSDRQECYDFAPGGDNDAQDGEIFGGH